MTAFSTKLVFLGALSLIFLAPAAHADRPKSHSIALRRLNPFARCNLFVPFWETRCSVRKATQSDAVPEAGAIKSLGAWIASAQHSMKPLIQNMIEGEKLSRTTGGSRVFEVLPYISQTLPFKTPLL